MPGETVRKTRRTETTLELHEVVVVRGQAAVRDLCHECGPETSIMLSPEAAAAFAQVPTRSVYQLLERGAVHSLEVSDNSVLVCLRSLLRTCKRESPLPVLVRRLT